MNLAQLRDAAGRNITRPIVGLLAKTPLTPSALTWFGFAVSVGAAVLVAYDNLLAAGLLVLVAGLFDMLDGALARHTGRVSRFGAVLDSTLDRLSEAAILVAAIFLFATKAEVGAAVLAGATLAGAMTVSYLRARTEALGLAGRSGLFTRPERVIVLALGLLIDQLIIALVIVAVFSFITAGQRLVGAWRQMKDD
ncbi:MAG: CDP-alcohol phosphatidyltransferase family protein [Dehalococcoidales bacterium]